MSDYESYIHYGRLLVILQVILIPVYFYLLSFVFVGGVIWFLDHSDLRFLSDIVVYGIGPLIMSVPFWFWTYGRRYQIGDAYETFGREVWRLPTSIKAFYGFNFVVGVIFLFPLITPIISLFGGYFIAIYLLKWREEGKLVSTQRKTVLITLLYLPLPLLVVIGFYFGYDWSEQSGILGFFLELIRIWQEQIDFLYTSAMILADAATVGGILYLIYEGAHQVDYTVKIPGPLITLVSAASFVVLESLYIVLPETADAPLGALFLIHFVIVILGVGMLIIRYWKGLTTREDTSFIGWVTLVFFQAVNFLSGNPDDPLIIFSRTSAILMAFAIFMLLFWIAYRHSSKRY